MCYIIFGCMQQRHVVAVICCVGLTISYIMRFSIALAITEMAKPLAAAEDPFACPHPRNGKLSNESLMFKPRFSWTEMQQGLILSSFFWGYGLTPIAGGLLSERYGAKPVLATGVALTGAFTVLTPATVHRWDWIGLIGSRVVTGLAQITYNYFRNRFLAPLYIILFILPFDWPEFQVFEALITFPSSILYSVAAVGLTREGEFYNCVSDIISKGVVYAALHTVVAHWIPVEERGTWATVIFSGAYLGNTISMLITSRLLLKYQNWEVIFYVYGTLGILWTFFFSAMTFSTPADHPLLGKDEKAVLCEYMAKVRKRKNNRGTPWKSILTSRPVWAVIIAMIGHDWAMFALITDIPKYMKSVLHFNVQQNGNYLASGYFLVWLVAICSGILVDKIQAKEYISLTTNRKLMNSIACVGPSFGLIGASYSGCNKTYAMLCLIIGMAFMGFFYPSLKVNPIDLAPNFAGTVGALCHSAGAVSGILVPYIIGLLTPNGFLMEWRLVFWISFFIIMGTSCIYCLIASADLQFWNDDTEEAPLLSVKTSPN